MIIVGIVFALIVSGVIGYIVNDAFAQVRENARKERIKIKCTLEKHYAIAQDKAEGLY